MKNFNFKYLGLVGGIFFVIVLLSFQLYSYYNEIENISVIQSSLEETFKNESLSSVNINNVLTYSNANSEKYYNLFSDVNKRIYDDLSKFDGFVFPENFNNSFVELKKENDIIQNDVKNLISKQQTNFEVIIYGRYDPFFSNFIAFISSLNFNYNKKISIIEGKMKILSFSMIVFFVVLLAVFFYFSGIRRRDSVALRDVNYMKDKDIINLIVQQIRFINHGDLTNRVHVSDKVMVKLTEHIDVTRKLFLDLIKKVKNRFFIISADANKLKLKNEEGMLISNDFSTGLSEIKSMMDVTFDKLNSIPRTITESIGDVSVFSENISSMSSEIDTFTNNSDVIKQSIQESTKKIKKSGESAQEIINVINIMHGITRQIEILALNATIQASANNSGLGFMIIAKEVQRLSFESKGAMQQIIELIKYIQEDIRIALSSVEETSKNIVINFKNVENFKEKILMFDVVSNDMFLKINDYNGVVLSDVEQLKKIIELISKIQLSAEDFKKIFVLTGQDLLSLISCVDELTNILIKYKV